MYDERSMNMEHDNMTLLFLIMTTARFATRSVMSSVPHRGKKSRQPRNKHQQQQQTQTNIMYNVQRTIT
jgi:hypothetical protein